MRNAAVVFCIAFMVFSFGSCKETIVTWEDNSEPGRRDYVWTADTVKGKYLIITRCSAISESNIWACGLGDPLYKIWHYNGNSWSPVTNNISGSAQAIIAEANGNVWVATSVRTIWKYNGENWVNNYNYGIEGYDQVVINNFCNGPSGVIYGAGYAYNSINKTVRGILWKYNGVNWSYSDSYLGYAFIDVRFDNESGNLYFTCYKYNPQDFIFEFKILAYDGKKYKVLYEGQKECGFGNIGGQLFIGIDNKIYKNINNQLVLFKDLSDQGYRNSFDGVGYKNFIGNSYTGLGHYNGNDFVDIYTSNLRLVWKFMFDKSIHIIFTDQNTNDCVFVKGTLQN